MSHEPSPQLKQTCAGRRKAPVRGETMSRYSALLTGPAILSAALLMSGTPAGAQGRGGQPPVQLPDGPGREIVQARGLLPPDQLEKALDVRAMTEPGLPEGGGGGGGG